MITMMIIIVIIIITQYLKNNIKNNNNIYKYKMAFLHPISFNPWPSRLWDLSTSRLWNS